MQYINLYQYTNLHKISGNYYGGELAIRTTDATQYTVSDPVNKLTGDNVTVISTPLVLEDTLSNQEDV